MEPSSSQSNDEPDYWEFVSGSKSLTTETVQSLLQSIEGESLKEKEEKKREEDWYTVIPPATPANTPEYTPTPPTYPSAVLRKEATNVEGGELFPIKELKEDIVEETNDTGNPSANGEDKFSFEYTPADSENEEQTSNTALNVIRSWLYHVAAYFIVFSIVKWVGLKIWERLESGWSVNKDK